MLSFGADPTAYIGIISGVLKIYSSASAAFSNEVTARKELVKAIEEAEKSAKDLVSAQEKGKSLAAVYKDWVAGDKAKTLKSKLDTYNAKVIVTREQAQELAKQLQESLIKQDVFPKNASQQIQEQYTKTVATQVESTVKLGATVSAGETLQREAVNLLAVIEQARNGLIVKSDDLIINALKTAKKAALDHDKHIKSATGALTMGGKIFKYTSWAFQIGSEVDF